MNASSITAMNKGELLQPKSEMGPTLIGVLGPPCAGKTTQLDILQRELRSPTREVVRVGLGDIIRQVQAGNPLYAEYAEDLNPYLNASNGGGLIPDEVALNVMRREITAIEQVKEGEGDHGNIFILDGFPRTPKQYDLLKDKILRSIPGAAAIFINFDISEKEVWKRMNARGGRPDDNKNAFVNRLENYRKKTKPAVEIMLDEGVVYEINAEGTQEEVTDRMFGNQPPGETPVSVFRTDLNRIRHMRESVAAD